LIGFRARVDDRQAGVEQGFLADRCFAAGMIPAHPMLRIGSPPVRRSCGISFSEDGNTAKHAGNTASALPLIARRKGCARACGLCRIVVPGKSAIHEDGRVLYCYVYKSGFGKPFEYLGNECMHILESNRQMSQYAQLVLGLMADRQNGTENSSNNGNLVNIIKWY
jgi:hypothetical protein